MLSDKVAQKPIMAVSAGTKTFQKAPKVSNCEGCAMSGPTPPARMTTQPRSQAARTRTMGAAQFSKTRTAFMPW